MGNYEIGCKMWGCRYWAEYGKLHLASEDELEPSIVDDRKRFQAGHVRLTTGKFGTEIKWYVISPNVSSLYAASVWMRDAVQPFILRFFLAGWFEETYDSSNAACLRIEEIVAKGDRHFSSHTVVKQFCTDRAELTPLLNDCLNGHKDPAEYAVECVFENSRHSFIVSKIGTKSAIAQVYGATFSSFPCRNDGAYNAAVSGAYLDVMRSRQPRYDHVFAAMKMPDNEVLWVPYRRVLLPNIQDDGHHSLQVISEIARVDIQLI
jgi:hypothetical protein